MAVKIPLKKVTIVTERLLREDIVELLKRHGATGWSIAAVEGEGSRGSHTSDFEGRNSQIDTIVSSEIADAIMGEIAEKYFEDWAVITYSCDVEVLRGAKYLG
ncbi:MAG: P-II family nitrogen regulator [Luteolibacter sp.]